MCVCVCVCVLRGICFYLFIQTGDVAYVDDRDIQWSKDACGATPAVVDLAKLSPQSFITYRFGTYVVDLVEARLRLPGYDASGVQLHIATSLPQSQNAKNAFQNSYMYDKQTKALYIRNQRLESVGEMVLCLVHALSHIQCGQMHDDTDPAFLKYFFSALQVCCEDLFMARATGGLAVAKPGTDGYNMMQTASTIKEKESIAAQLANIPK